MSQQTATLYNNAELALAAYATLTAGPTATADQLDRLVAAGMSRTQAEQFAQRYTNVVTQVTGSETGFSATVFQDASGQLTLAVRGTEFLPSDLATDALIAFNGAGYDQIVDMYNWWLRVSSVDTMVSQFRITKYAPTAADIPATGFLYADAAGDEAYLEAAPAVLSTGEVAAFLSADPDQRLDVAGHSLGAHLSLAFNALFSSTVNNVFGYNTPGFIDNAINQTFFQTLGSAAQTTAAVPTQANSGNATNVLANEATVGQQPFNAISGLHSVPGNTFGFAIEDQTHLAENQPFLEEPAPPPTLNHNQGVLTDSLAVFDLLNGLAPTLTMSDYGIILGQAASGTAGSYEGIVDALQVLFGVDQTRLPVGNSQREALYQAMYDLRSRAAYIALSGSLSISASPTINAETLATQAKQDFGHFLSVYYLLPFVVDGAPSQITSANADLYARWNADRTKRLEGREDFEFTDQYFSDRAAMLAAVSRGNTENRTSIVHPDIERNVEYVDNSLGIKIELRGGTSTLPSSDPLARYAFGTSQPGTLAGTLQDDHLYAEQFGATLAGRDGADYLEGGAGVDQLEGGDGNDTLRDLDHERGDRLIGGAGTDTYIAEFGDSITDTPEASAGAVYVYLDGEKVQLTGGSRNEGEAFYTSADGRFKYWTDSRGAIAIFPTAVSVGDAALRIEAPDRTVPGQTDTPTESVRGRPDLGISLVEHKDPTKAETPSVPVGVKGLWDLARTWRPFSDPLALDLGGNGFQTVGDLGAGSVLFDHDGNGVRNGTGWLTGADAWVVMDRDGDGEITSGKELFGVDTVLPNGTTGANGFTAIAPLDTNGDHKISATDAPLAAWTIRADANGDGVIGLQETRGASFSDLRLWRDENLNGIAEPFELTTLADAGVVSINLDQVVSGAGLPGGNSLAFRGTFTRADGTTGTAGALNLTRELFYRSYSSSPSYTPGVEALPVMLGSGRVRDLQEAAASSPALRDALTAAGAVTTRAAQLAAIDNVVAAWAASSDMPAGTAQAAAQVKVITYGFPGVSAAVNPIDAYTLIRGGGQSFSPVALPGWFEQAQSQAYRDRVKMLEVVERFTGQTFVNLDTAPSVFQFSVLVPGQNGQPPLQYNVSSVSSVIPAANWDFVTQSYAQIRDATYGAVALQTRLLPYVNALIAGTPTRDFSSVDGMLMAKRATDPVGALADAVELVRYMGDDLISRGWTSVVPLIQQWSEQARQDPAMQQALADLRILFRDQASNSSVLLTGSAVGDVMFNTSFEPNNGSSVPLPVDGGFGDDLFFGALTARGQAMFGRAGDDIFYGGPGYQQLSGGAGRDVYLFGRGSGTDDLVGPDQPNLSLASAADRDVVQMLPGVSPDDLRVRIIPASFFTLPTFRIGIIGTSDALFDAGIFSESKRAIDEVRFADGTVWDIATLRLKALEGSDLDDTRFTGGAEYEISGFETDDFIDAKAGNDKVFGDAGRDTLVGGLGNDTLLGWIGDDLLFGGDGDDSLEGGPGSDTYWGGKGNDTFLGLPTEVDTYMLERDAGSDSVFTNVGNLGGQVAQLDILRVADGITPDEVIIGRPSQLQLTFRVVGSDTLLTDSGTNFFHPLYVDEINAPNIGRVEFSDGTVWDSATIKAKSIIGSAGDDTIQGFQAQADFMPGGDGNDVIFGLGKDDTLDGGLGNDTLRGGAGNDSLLGGAGDDWLEENEFEAAENDYFDGGDGNDSLFAWAGDDTLVGGDGDDTLIDFFGTNLLIGGRGNDSISCLGGIGQDTVVFTSDGGQDVASGIEVLRLDGGLRPQDVEAWQELGDVVVRVVATNAQIRMTSGLQSVVFSDGTSWDQAFLAALPARATEGNDQLVGSNAADAIFALGGNDTVQGLAGDDTLDGGAGIDQLFGGAGDDVYYVDSFGDQVTELPDEGVDSVIASVSFVLPANVERLTLAGEDDISGVGNELDNILAGSSAQEFLQALGGSDTLIGNQGDDQLFGGAGADFYYYALGDGSDSIQDTPGDQNTLRLQGILPGDVQVSGSLDSGFVQIFHVASNGSVSLSSTTGTGLAVSAIEFDDGTVWHEQDVVDRLPPPPAPPITGTAGDDTLVGDQRPDFISGLGGNDVLIGGAGNDLLDGGPGNDTLDGGAGSDAYLISADSGIDTIIDEASASALNDLSDQAAILAMQAAGELNVAQIEAPLAGVTLGVDGDRLVVRLGASREIDVAGFNRLDALGAHAIKAYVFVDGGVDVLTHAQLLARGFDLTGTADSDVLLGTNLQDRFDGLGGADTLDGGRGDDVYAFTLGSGHDVINDADTAAGNVDIVRMAAGITPASVQVSHQSGAIVLQASASDSVAIRWNRASGEVIERVEFDDGTVWNADMLEQLAGLGDNTAPTVASPIEDQTAIEDSAFSFTVPANTFADVDVGDTLTYGATLADGTALPSWLGFSATTRTFSGTPLNANVGFIDVRVTATDSGNASASDIFRITVANTNDAPTVANLIPDQTATEDAAFSFTVPANTFADVDVGDTLAYSATLADGTALPSWLGFNPTTRVLSGTPLNANVGFIDVRVTATDSANASASDIFRVTVANTNDAPTVANLIPDQTATEDAAFSFTLPANTFADVDVGDTLTYGATLTDGTALPSWLGFNPTTRVFSGTPLNANVGFIDVKVTATDSGNASASDIFRITVANTNDAPTVANLIPDQTATEDAAFSFTVPANTFADVDVGDTLTYSATLSSGVALPSWLGFNATTRTFSGTALNANVGFIDVKVTATDSGNASTSDIFRITVANTNDAPTVANLIADQTATEDAAFSFTVPVNTFADVDVGDTLTYGATLADGTALPSWLGFNATTRTFSGTPLNANVGFIDVKVKATDSGNASASDIFRIAVANTNDAPTVANLILDQAATEDAVFSFTVPANTFADVDVGDTLTYGATLADGTALPSWLGFNATTRTFSGTPLNANVGFVDVKVTAADSGNASASDIFRITVANTNDAPTVANPIADQTANLSQAFSFTVPANSFADVDVGDTLGYSATLSSGAALPAWVSFNAATRTFSGTPGTADLGTFDVLVRASDSGGLSASDVFTIVVAQQSTQGTAGPDTLTGTPGDDVMNGFAGNDTLNGGAGNDTLDGGAGVDVMAGGTGNDFYRVDDTADVVTENMNEGIDTVETGLQSYTLPANVENLTLTDTGGNGTGNTLNNLIVGNFQSNTLRGDAGNDTLIGGGGFADNLIGGTGNDTYEIGWAFTGITENLNEGVDTVRSSVDYTLGANVEDLTLIGTSAINGTGNALANVITGNSANNTLDGGAGVDTMIGGLGNDTYVLDSAAEVVTENANEGSDTIQVGFTYTLTAANVENVTLTGTSAINATGNALNNVLTGNSAANILTGGLGNDTYVVGTGDTAVENANEGIDTVQASISWTLGNNFENLALIGTSAINATGNGVANVLTGNEADNTLSGAAGIDTMIGGLGNDTYVVDSASEIVTENANEGIDTIQAGFSYTLTAANVENLTLTGTSAINGTGNVLDNVLTGNGANNILTGGLGNDTYVITSGDTVVENANEGIDTIQAAFTYTLTAANVENVTLIGSSVINATGNALDNVLTGNSAANTLTGGLGNDTYVVGTGDTVVENANGGIDTVQSSITWTLGNNIENLTLTGTAAINGTGNALDNVLTGNSANNVLNGGAGNDTYIVSSGDTVTEAVGGGTDTVIATSNWTLSANVENLTLTEEGVAGTITGNALNNVLTGNSFTNFIDGLAGADTMIGGLGGDWYTVDNAGDVIIEDANPGDTADAVFVSFTYTLGANLENLTLTGTSAINGTGNTANNALTGNSANNVLTGGAGNDTLDGGAGNDTMLGGTGDDTYVVAQTADVITENANEGIDSVQSSITWTLGNNLENLALTGSAVINGTGNALDNVLSGNGNLAANVLSGGLGNDTYIVGAGAADTVIENANEGVDTVQSSTGWTLGNNIENLTLIGIADNGTGNALANVLTGNSMSNTLTGAAGNDTLDGGAGADTLAGGTGNDTYRLGRGYGADVIQENDSTAGNTDIAQFLAGVSRDQIWFQQTGNDLVATIIGRDDRLTVQNWYLGSANHVEQFKTADGSTLLDSNVQNLVNAMAAFAPPAPGQETLPPNYAAALNPVIAANWQ